MLRRTVPPAMPSDVRKVYDVYDLPAESFTLTPFDRGEALSFVEAFAKNYGVTIDSARLLTEL